MVPALAQAATYYVGKAGSDSYTCTQAQSVGTPKLSVTAGVACMSGGDTLVIGDGTYTERIMQTIPGGSATARTVVRAANRNGAILKPSGSGDWNVITITGRSYITVDGIVADAMNVDGMAYTISGTATNVILRNGTARNSRLGNGIFIQDGTTTDNQILNMDINNNGTVPSTLQHGIYVRGSRNIIDGNRIYNNSGYGIHQYAEASTPSNNIFRNNKIYGNVTRGVIISKGDGSLFYNNLVYKNARGVEIDGTNIKVYNNTIYSNSGNCLWILSGTGHRLQDNICYGNTSDGVVNNGGSSTISSNLFANPSFVDASASNFALSSNSAAIDAGIALSEVVTDFVGTVRPQGQNQDIGAYEYTSGGSSSSSGSSGGGSASSGVPAPPANLRVVAQ